MDIEKGDEAMICSVRTLGIHGIKGSGVVAECYISNGLPAFDIVGLPDAAVKEARERVRAAAKNSGLTFPVSRPRGCLNESKQAAAKFAAACFLHEINYSLRYWCGSTQSLPCVRGGGQNL